MGSMAATPALVPTQGTYPPAYRPRHPRATSLYQLFVNHYETVKAVWEERFERRYGFWRGFYDNTVAKYLDCGLFESGFARVVCPRCHAAVLVAFSCKRPRVLPVVWGDACRDLLRAATTSNPRRCPSRPMGFPVTQNASTLLSVSNLPAQWKAASPNPLCPAERVKPKSLTN